MHKEKDTCHQLQLGSSARSKQQEHELWTTYNPVFIFEKSTYNFDLSQTDFWGDNSQKRQETYSNNQEKADQHAPLLTFAEDLSPSVSLAVDLWTPSVRALACCYGKIDKRGPCETDKDAGEASGDADASCTLNQVNPRPSPIPIMPRFRSETGQAMV